MESLMYKTPSPVTAKRRLSGIPVSRTSGLGRAERVVSEHAQRIQREWPELQEERVRRGSVGNSSESIKNWQEMDSVDSSMGFRELERHIAKIKRQNFDLKLELHIRREKMTANAEKVHKAEKLLEENDELRETLRETQISLKSREDELADCKSLIRLLSNQLEHAHNRIAALVDAPRSVQTIESPSQEIKSTSILQSSEFVNTSPGGSPTSLVSLESSIGGLSYDEPMAEIETFPELKEPLEPTKKNRIPLQLEHAPKTIRRQSVLAQIPPPSHRTPSNERSQIPMKRNSKPVTPSVTRVNAEKTQLPYTPKIVPLPAKRLSQRPSLRSRIFKSKSDLCEVKQQSEPEVPVKSLVKKNSLIHFWRSKSANKKDDRTRTKKDLSVSSETTPVREITNLTAPHESDNLSPCPKTSPMSIATTTQNTNITPNSEWRHKISRQVAEMVRHWEDETSRRNDKMVSCATYVSSKCLSSPNIKDTGVRPLAARAVRDTLMAESSASMTAISGTSSFRSGR